MGYKKPRYRAGKPSCVAPNRLEQNFEVAEPDSVWATDITYIRTHEGWLYLAVVMDLCSKMVVCQQELNLSTFPESKMSAFQGYEFLGGREILLPACYLAADTTSFVFS